MNPYEQYRWNQVSTADQKTLILMLYDGAIRFLHEAETALEHQRIEAAHNHLLRTQDILTELAVTLDIEAGDVARNLARLYAYMIERLMHANVTKIPEPVLEVRGLLAQLREAWAQADVNTPEPTGTAAQL